MKSIIESVLRGDDVTIGEDNSQIQSNSDTDESGGLIKWLKNSFKFTTGLLFFVTIIAFTIAGAMIGEEQGNLMLGLWLGLAAGVLIGIHVFGYFATIINISEQNEKILEYLKKKDS